MGDKKWLELQRQINLNSLAVSECERHLTPSHLTERLVMELELERKKITTQLSKCQKIKVFLGIAIQNSNLWCKHPGKHFNCNKVKGIVAHLMRINEPGIINPIEVIAGGKLYNIVVDTEE